MSRQQRPEHRRRGAGAGNREHSTADHREGPERREEIQEEGIQQRAEAHRAGKGVALVAGG